MKKYLKYLFLMLVILSLSACNKSDVESTPTAEPISISDIHTAAVLTMTAQATEFTQTPSATSTESPSPTLPPTQTLNVPTQKAASPIVSNITAVGCNDAVYVSDITIPDGTVFAPGTTFVKTWQIKNIGTCDWSAAYKLAFISGDVMGGKEAVLGEIITAGNSKSISVSLTAPSANGTYYGYWKMADGSGAAFGGTVYVMIKVSNTATSATPTLTPTGKTATISAATAAPTATTTVTDTAVPTETDTVTSIEETITPT